MNPLETHLTDDEIDCLLNSAEGEPGAGTVRRNELLRHADACPGCASRMMSARNFRAALSEVSRADPLKTAGDCPGTAEWAAFYAGALTQPEADRLLEHAAGCGWCAARLKAVLSTDDDPPLSTAESPAVLQFPKPRQSVFRRSKWTGAIAAAVLLALLPAGLLLRRYVGTTGSANLSSVAPEDQRSADRALSLLSQAASTHRPGDFRFPGASHSDSQIRRGFDASVTNPPLSDARSLLDHLPAGQRSQPAWVQAQARRQLLEGHYAKVLEDLQPSLGGKPGPTDLEIGLAYFERAEAQQQNADYQNSIEFFSRRLTQVPNDPDALFNRALAYEKLLMYAQAAEAWRICAALDNGAGWADEIRRHLETCRAKLARHEEGARSHPPEDAAKALIRKLGEAPFDSAKSPVATYSADRWAVDFAVRPQRDRDAHHALHAGIRFNQDGDSNAAEASARKALDHYRTVGNPAGELRAAYEASYALQRLSRGSECMQLLNTYLPVAMRHPYPWLQVQLLIQQGNCANMIGDSARAAKDADEGMRIARGANLPDLELRALGLQATTLTNSARYADASKVDLEGLATYWKGTFHPIRAQHLYYDLLLGAAATRHWYTAENLAQESAEAAKYYGDRSFQAISLAKAAEFAARHGAFKESRAFYERAVEIFRELPDNRIRAFYQTYAALGLAELEGPAGLERLAPIEGLLPGLTNQSVVGRYLNVRARLLAANGDLGEAENCWTRLVRMGKVELKNLSGSQARSSWQQEMSAATRELVRLEVHRGQVNEARAAWDAHLAEPAANGASKSEDDPGLTRVCYVQHPEELLIFVECGKAVHYYHQPLSSGMLRDSIRRLTLLASDPASDEREIRRAGSALYQMLLAPAHQWLAAGTQLVLVTDGELNSVPWNVVTLPDGRYFAEEVQATSLPGISAPPARTLPDARQTRALVIASPVAGKEWSGLLAPLPETREEADAVAARFPATVLTGRDATLANVRRWLPQATLLHFAGHAVQHGGSASLILAPGDASADWEEAEGFWQPGRSKPWELTRCALAIFSACSTSVADSEANGADSMVRSMLAAGIPRVVATRWDINSSAAVLFMDRFYAYLVERGNVADAVRRAAKSLRDNPRTAHPYYWAGFEAFGYPDAVRPPHLRG